MLAHPPRRFRATLLTLCAGVLTLAGCGESGGEEPTGLDEATTSATTTPTATDEATATDEPTEAGPTEHAFPEAGVTIVTPPPSGPAEAAALATYVEFAREWRWSLGEVRLSEQLAGLAAAPVVDGVESSLEYQVDNGIRYGGQMVITPVVEESSDTLVVLGGCVDGSEVVLIDDGEERAPDGVDQHPVIPMHAVLANDGGGWRVNENTLDEDESC
ncbi:hypothetical protein E1262_26310 [Jiangella aurantiaca]|uniref:Lipoprotein n=1 Tax=Jiangella aurantiaca TaxID=2530373 RepID=A0A4R5A647_9ACTN|nr:hypothetical protein [Jiangella aurantiaca]TDD65062.1 hypothetical protein E1262_26310 [Jiangella aurantiaca]